MGIYTLQPSLTLVQGSSQPATAWLDFPPTIDGRSPYNKNLPIRFRLAKGDIVKAALNARRAPAFEAWSVLLGSPPPVPNITSIARDYDLSVLADAHACFQGIKRPCGEDDFGDEMLVYVLAPKFVYHFDHNMSCVATKRPVPEELLYVAHVRLDQPVNFADGPPRGIFTHGGFVERDPADNHLPVDHAVRYQRRHW